MGALRGLPGMCRRLPASVLVFAALFLLLAIVTPRFLSLGNLTNVARVAAILALASYGQAIAIITGGLDFSAGSSVALVSVIVVLAAEPFGGGAALGLGALTAIAIGAANGILIGRFELPPFLATLGMLIGIWGLANMLVGGIPLEAPASLNAAWLGQARVAGITVPVIAAAAGYGILWLLLRQTVLGRSWYLLGANRRAAHAAGIAVPRSLFLAYLIAGAFTAAAGLILTARVNSGQPNLYPSLPFEAIAACAVGGLSLSGGAGRPLQVLMGVLTIAIINNAVVLLNQPPALQLMTIGALTVLSVLLQQVRWRRPAREARMAAEP